MQNTYSCIFPLEAILTPCDQAVQFTVYIYATIHTILLGQISLNCTEEISSTKDMPLELRWLQASMGHTCTRAHLSPPPSLSVCSDPRNLTAGDGSAVYSLFTCQ